MTADSTQTSPFQEKAHEMQASQQILISTYLEWLGKQGAKDLPNESLMSTRVFAASETQLRPSIRGYFIFKIAQQIWYSNFQQALDSKMLANLALVGEYCITILYLENHFHDEKFGVNTPQTRLNNRLELVQTRKDMYRFIAGAFGDDRIRSLIETKLQEIFDLYEIGLMLDKEFLKFKNFKSNTPHITLPDEIEQSIDAEEYLKIFDSYARGKYPSIKNRSFLKILIQRAYLINTVFFHKITELLIAILGKTPSQQNQSEHAYLLTFSRMFGMTQQLVNDNCDFLPLDLVKEHGLTTVCKFAEDTFSDFRRGLLTFPLISYFTKIHEEGAGDNDPLLAYFKGEQHFVDLTTSPSQHEVLNRLVAKQALKHSMSILNGLADTGLAVLPPHTVPYLTDMFSFVRGNRFYKIYTSFPTHN